MFEWSDEYKVGIVLIDTQHKKLFALLDKLRLAISAGRGRTVVRNTLDGVVAYTKEHFAVEEGLMATYKYPGYPAHKKIHDDLIVQATRLIEKTKANPLTVSLEISKFLENWISHHISGTDRGLARFLIDKGLK